tara:strand:+ start:3961 stop:4167 length:207 start_codon:yes stop_codon:yes gene_type:complete
MFHFNFFKKLSKKSVKPLEYLTKNEVRKLIQNGYNPLVTTRGPLNHVNIKAVAILNKEDLEYLDSLGK